MDFLKLFDSWYRVLMVLGGGVFVGSLFFPVHGVSPQQSLILSGGVFLWGLGEWKNHKERSWIKEANAYTGGPGIFTATVREPDLLGVLLELVGFSLIGWAIWRFFHHL